jgi:hypothetical protein
MTRCGRCGLRVSPGICAEPPLVFHDRPEDCVEALKAELTRVRKEFNDEMREAQRACAAAYREGRAEAESERWP